MGREKVVLEAENFQAVTEEDVSEEAQERSDTENGVFVKGMALPFGKVSRNGAQYEEESVRETCDQLVGRSMLFNHRQDFATGHILNVECTEDGMFFEGDINPNAEMPNGVPVAEAVKRGDISSVSIQAFVEEAEGETDEDAVVQDMETQLLEIKDWIEISPVTTPGFTDTGIVPEHLQDQGVKAVSEIISDSSTNNSRESSDSGSNSEEDKSGEPFAGYDDFDECVEDNQDKDDPEAYCGELKDRLEDLDQEFNKDSEEDDDMSEDDGSEDFTIEAFDDLSEQDMFDLIASHYGELGVEDVAELYEDFEFQGWDERELASLLADALDVSQGDILEMFEDMMENVEASDDDEDDEEDEEDGNSEDKDEEGEDASEQVEELKEEIENLKESKEALEERLDKFLDEEKAESKQDLGNEATIKRKPSFKDALP